MFKPFEVFIGLRYVRAKRRNHFISFISLSSILGVTLGVTAVITVLSVMNGFEKEVKERTLEMVSHATLLERSGAISNWQDIIQQLEAHPGVTGVAPYLQTAGMLSYRNEVNSALIRGIIPDLESKVSDIRDKMIAGEIGDLTEGKFGMVVGKNLSDNLGVSTGDKLILLVVSQSDLSPVKMPRRKQFTIVGIFETGMYEYDNRLAVIHMHDAQRLLDLDGPSGLSIKTNDVMNAPDISRAAASQLGGQYGIVDWTQRNRNFFTALKTQKLVMFVILSLIVAVAAFNIISTLVMMVVDKQADIAILRTLGASPRSIMKIFIVQGTIIGLLGMLLGDIMGIWLANNIDGIVGIVEAILDIKVLPCDVYYVCDFPTDMHWIDVIFISIITFILCLLATIYPAWRAARTQPAETLRYE